MVKNKNIQADKMYRDWRRWIDGHAGSSVFVSEVVGYAKPDQRIFEMAMQHFGVDPSETVFVGDNWTADIVGAINAGISAVWINRRKSLRQPIINR